MQTQSVRFGGACGSKAASDSSDTQKSKKKSKHSQPPPRRQEDEFVTLARQTRSGLVQDTRALAQDLQTTRQQTARDFARDVRGMQADIHNILHPQQPNQQEVDDLLEQMKDLVRLEQQYPPSNKK